MAIFKGAGVAITTPFKANGEVDYDTFREQIEYQIANGTDAIIVCGTTGEASCLSHEEHLDCIKFCCEVVNKRIPVIAGTGSNCTEKAIYLSKEAEAAGADALLLVTPYYNKATQKGWIKHFTEIAQAFSLPIILYNVPSRTGCTILPETVAYLAKHVKNIVGIKEASGDIAQIAKVKQLASDDIELYSGNDDEVVPIMSLGGLGVISVLANIAPRFTHEMVWKYLEGDVKGSCEMQLKALPLISALFYEVNPIPVKAALNLMGKKVGPLRAPLYEMEAENQEKLRKAMLDMGVECQ